MKKRLGEMMLESGLITAAQLQHALEVHQKRKLPLGKIFIELNLLTEQQISEALSKQFGCPYINLVNYQIKPEIAALLPLKLIQRYEIIPVGEEEGRLLVAAADPSNVEAIDVVRQITKRELKLCYAPEEEIQFVVNRFYNQKQLVEDASFLKQDQMPMVNEEVVNLLEEVPIVKFLNTLLSSAFQERASDIHLEPGLHELRIRVRIDGSLYERQVLSLNFHAALVSRIKVLANLDIAEKRMPQDGRVPIEIEGRQADLRVSIIPSNFGEKIVLRIFLKQAQLFNLESMGLNEIDQKLFAALLTYPYGLIYVSGPTGCGKTTTLYAFLHHLNDVHKNLLTLEDPIEYVLPGVTQVNIHPKIGLTFAAGLRAFLRQDPDVIMVGETRDEETAQITVQAALTGHLVLSTIHTNDALGVVNRLLNMNLESYLIASALVGVVAQRLVRRICPKCKTPESFPKEYLRAQCLPTEITYYYGKGCEYCQNTGFLGRIGIYEILKVTEEMREAIAARASQQELKKLALAQGMRLLRVSGMELVKQGVTTIEEVLRVTAFK